LSNFFATFSITNVRSKKDNTLFHEDICGNITTLYIDGIQEAGGSNPLTQTMKKARRINVLRAFDLCRYTTEYTVCFFVGANLTTAMANFNTPAIDSCAGSPPPDTAHRIPRSGILARWSPGSNSSEQDSFRFKADEFLPRFNTSNPGHQKSQQSQRVAGSFDFAKNL